MLQIIATPSHVGEHLASRPNQFLPIIKHPEDLHSKNYLHGDIRAYNMVLHNDPPENPFGKLIDFDYGGDIAPDVISNESNPKYPSR